MALYLSHWNVPYLSHGCLDPDLRDKSYYNTFIRGGTPPYGKVGLAFGNIFEHYGWDRGIFMIEDEGGTSTCEYGAEGIEIVFKQRNISVAEWIRLPTSAEGRIPTSRIDGYLNRARNRGRGT